MIYIQKLNDAATFPTVATEGSVGLDLHSIYQSIIAPGECATISTGIAAKLPHGYEGQVRGRSGLAARGILCHVGTIDTDYTGEIKAILFNLSGAPFEILRGDRIAQLVVSPIMPPVFTPVLMLPETSRGSNGFGSSGR